MAIFSALNFVDPISRDTDINAAMCTGFVRVLENLESPGISFCHFPGLESPGKWPRVLESPGNLN